MLGETPFFKAKGAPGAAGNLAYEFASDVARKCDRDVNLVLLASDGKKIEYFLPNAVLRRNRWTNKQNSSSFGKSIADEVLGADGEARRALHALGKDMFDVVLFHQGEANSLADADAPAIYEAKFAALVQQLTDRYFIERKRPIIVGNINSKYPGFANHAAALDMLDDLSPRISVAHWKGIETMPNGNNHATGAGLRELGDRYFKAWKRSAGRCR